MHQRLSSGKKPIIIALFICLTGSVLAGIIGCDRYLAQDIKQQTFTRLEAIKAAKADELIRYFRDIHRLAEGAGTDPLLLGFFDQTLGSLARHGTVDQTLEYAIDSYFVEKYGDFYDILFVDSKGYVFHSIKKESDYRTNLLAPDSPHARIKDILNRKRRSYFVDYDFYLPSNEPAAFFVVPARGEREPGWFILQCPINRINRIFTSRKGLGRTGEVYLINRSQLMLTDSRFFGDSTILKQKVDTRAAGEAFEVEKGERIIEDYRGKRVFSSYQRLELFGSIWVIIAEMDESEVLTDHYRRYQDHYHDRLVERLSGSPSLSSIPGRPAKETKRIDVNEYAMSRGEVALKTYGVATCTAVVILYPGRFAYLLHYSPLDRSYSPGLAERFFQEEMRSDFLSEVIRKMTHYDIYPSEKTEIQFLLIAPHPRSFKKAVAIILDQGFDLANIRILYEPEARSANVSVDPAGTYVDIEWATAKGISAVRGLQKTELETVFKRVLAYN